MAVEPSSSVWHPKCPDCQAVMRKFHRPSYLCPNCRVECGARLLWFNTRPTRHYLLPICSHTTLCAFHKTQRYKYNIDPYQSELSPRAAGRENSSLRRSNPFLEVSPPPASKHPLDPDLWQSLGPPPGSQRPFDLTPRQSLGSPLGSEHPFDRSFRKKLGTSPRLNTPETTPAPTQFDPQRERGISGSRKYGQVSSGNSPTTSGASPRRLYRHSATSDISSVSSSCSNSSDRTIRPLKRR